MAPAPVQDLQLAALDPRERFLASIFARVPLARIAEVHLFPPIRQAQLESGVAVIAAEREPEPVAVAAPAEESAAEVEVVADVEVEEPAPEPELSAELPAGEPDDAAPAEPDSRLVVYTATYRFTRRGPERGKWEVDIVAEADAPLVSVERVIRGMRDRLGDDAESERLDAEALRALVESPAWRPAS